MANTTEGRDYRSIGNPTPEIATSPNRSASTPTRSETSSAATGALSPAAKPSSSTGRSLSKTDAESLLGAALRGQDARETDRLMIHFLSELLGSKPQENRKPMYNSEYGYDEKFIGYTIPPITKEQKQIAVRMVEFASVPAAIDIIAAELSRLRVMTRKRQDASDELLVGAYTDELRRYPPDVVRGALRAWPSEPEGKWFPAWHDLQELLDARILRRTVLLHTLRAADTGDFA